MHNFWPVSSHNSWEERIIQISNNLLLACLVLGFTVISKWALDSQSVFYSKKSKEGSSKLSDWRDTVLFALVTQHPSLPCEQSAGTNVGMFKRLQLPLTLNVMSQQDTNSSHKGNEVLCLCDLCFRFLCCAWQLKPATLLWVIKTR